MSSLNSILAGGYAFTNATTDVSGGVGNLTFESATPHSFSSNWNVGRQGKKFTIGTFANIPDIGVDANRARLNIGTVSNISIFGNCANDSTFFVQRMDVNGPSFTPSANPYLKGNHHYAFVIDKLAGTMAGFRDGIQVTNCVFTPAGNEVYSLFIQTSGSGFGATKPFTFDNAFIYEGLMSADAIAALAAGRMPDTSGNLS